MTRASSCCRVFPAFWGQLKALFQTEEEPRQQRSWESTSRDNSKVFTAVLERKNEVSSVQVKRDRQWDFLSGPVANTALPVQAVQAQSLVEGLKSHMPRDATKKNH